MASFLGLRGSLRQTMAAKDLTQWHTLSLVVGEGGMGMGWRQEAHV